MSPASPASSVLLVLSAAGAIKGEAAVRRAGICCALVPLPRTLSSECGVCLQVCPDDRERVEEMLAHMGVEITAIHDVTVRPPREETASE
jgi:hypothetical protein